MAGWIVSRARLSRSRFVAPMLFCFGIGIAYIGLDDMMVLHERIGFVLNHIFKNGGFNGESFNWLLYFSPLMLLAIATFLFLLRWLWKISRFSFATLSAGLALWMMSIGTEWIGGRMILSQVVNVARYRELIVAEEGLEMFGASFIAIAMFILLHQLFQNYVRVEIMPK